MIEEVHTEIKQGSPEWFAWRQGGIGATDAAAIFGKSKYGTALSVYSKKLGLDKREFEKTAVQEWGNRIETLLIDKFMEEHANACNLRRGGLFMSDWKRCSLDGSCDLVDTSNHIGLHERVIIECKTARSADEWNPVPDGYYAQVQWQMHVTGMHRAFFSVLVAGYDWFEREVTRDDMYIAQLDAACTELWDRIQRHDPPKPMHVLADIDGTALSQIATGKPSKEPEAPVQLTRDEVAKYYLLKDRMDKADAAFKDYKSDLQFKMTGGSSLEYDGHCFARYISRGGSETIDKRLLKAKYPEAYAACVHRGGTVTYPRFA